MYPTPKGYINIPVAVTLLTRARHGKPETIPWRGKELDQAVLTRARKRATEAQEWLIAELSAGRLVVEIDDLEMPAEYWTCNEARTTVHTGRLQPPETSIPEYTELAHRPCFIERNAFKKRLSTIGGRPGRKPGGGAIDDLASLEEMARLIDTGEANGGHDAARIIAPGAGGTGTEESKQKRLWRKWQALP